MSNSDGSIREGAQTGMARQFDRLAPCWDEKHGPRSLNRIPLQMLSAYLRDLCASYRRPRILDIGCGTGQQLFALADHLKEGVGIDISPAMVERARLNASQRGLEDRLSFHVLAAEDVCRKRLGVFDVVLFLGSLEHMVDPQLSLALAAKVLQPAGAAVLVMVHPWHPRSFYARFAARIGAIPPFRHLAPRTLRQSAAAAGLRPTDPFGSDCLSQVSGVGRFKHRALQGLAAPAVFGIYVAVIYARASKA
jgi:2-polyprenyl-3-methyl-5-hydroxy-6-metoxy-1,4-benzoquinol methylase